MEGPVISPGANGTVPTGNAFPTIDASVVVEHLAAVLEITLGASRRDLEGLGSLLSKPKHSETIQRCTRFASESQVAIYVQKDAVATSDMNGPVDGLGTWIYQIGRASCRE